MPSAAPLPRTNLPWVSVIPGVPYFQTEDGHPFHPIGHNDAISWADLDPLFRRRDLPAVSRYLANLAAHGVTTLRLMLEYAQVRHRYIESAPGVFAPNMVRLWDDLFALSEQHGLRILLTPFDTFWMWLHFHHHPYNARFGGPLRHPSRALLSRANRTAIKARLTFAAERWGSSGALFAWDLWNEIHPAQAEMSSGPFLEFIEDLSTHVRATELRAHGRAHPQTVSLFGPELTARPHLKMEHAVFRHPSLDFANLHIYEEGTIDHPRNTVDAAISMGRIVRQSLTELIDTRPFFDSEHGPIHAFKDLKRTLPAAFDDELFRHMQWAHLASGGAGGGMRWPNRKPHRLTPGMHLAQQSLAAFLPHINWHHFPRTNVSASLLLTSTPPAVTSTPPAVTSTPPAVDLSYKVSSRPKAERSEAAVERPASAPAHLRAPLNEVSSRPKAEQSEAAVERPAVAPAQCHTSRQAIPEPEPSIGCHPVGIRFSTTEPNPTTAGAPYMTVPSSCVGSSAPGRSPTPVASTPIPESQLARFACATPDQALVYLLRRDTLLPNGQLNPTATPLTLSLTLPILAPGTWTLHAWDTARGTTIATTTHHLSPDCPAIPLPPLCRDLALALRRTLTGADIPLDPVL